MISAPFPIHGRYPNLHPPPLEEPISPLQMKPGSKSCCVDCCNPAYLPYHAPLLDIQDYGYQKNHCHLDRRRRHHHHLIINLLICSIFKIRENESLGYWCDHWNIADDIFDPNRSAVTYERNNHLLTPTLTGLSPCDVYCHHCLPMEAASPPSSSFSSSSTQRHLSTPSTPRHRPRHDRLTNKDINGMMETGRGRWRPMGGGVLVVHLAQ